MGVWRLSIPTACVAHFLVQEAALAFRTARSTLRDCLTEFWALGIEKEVGIWRFDALAASPMRDTKERDLPLVRIIGALTSRQAGFQHFLKFGGGLIWYSC